MSNAKQESSSMLISYGTTIQLSQTKLLIHIHDGHNTCDDCEPGLLLQPSQSKPIDLVGEPVQLTYKQELKKIKKRYGLEDQSEYSTYIQNEFLHFILH